LPGFLNSAPGSPGSAATKLREGLDFQLPQVSEASRMDDLKKLLDLGTEALAVFKDHIPLLLAVIVIVCFVATRLQRAIDNGEIRGLKAQNDAIKEQLALAESKHDVVTSEIDDPRPWVGLRAVPALCECRRVATRTHGRRD
jgi:hypothetical protein